MAAVGWAGAALPPRYLHEAAVTVPLAYPFEIDGRRVDKAALVHPSLDALEFLRAQAELSARAILHVVSVLPVAAIGALRWPDVETILAAALTLLPADFIAQVEGVDVEDSEYPAKKDAVVSDAAALEPVDVAAELNLNPADFSFEV